MKKVLIFARDPGGANTVIPLIKKMHFEYNLLVYAKDYAIPCMERENISCIDIMNSIKECTEDEIFFFVENLHVDFVITGTSLNDYTERYIWKAAERLHIFAFAIIDQWINLGIRFSKYDYTGKELYMNNPKHPYLPYKIFVMDQNAANMILADGLDKERICVTGQPHFDEILQKYNQSTFSGKDVSLWNIVFVSEPISEDYDIDSNNMYWGYNELTIFDNLYQVLIKINKNINRKIQLIIRPHPRDNINKWKEIIKNLSDENINVIYDIKADSYTLLRRADVVCGMSSMLLLEAAICQVPIISIQIGLAQLSPFVLDKLNICKSIYNVDDLEKKLLELNEKKFTDIKFPIIHNATENCLDYIKEVVENECVGN